MKKIYLATLFFCLMSVSLSAQLVEVVDGLNFPFGLVLDDNDLYVSQQVADKISKFDITDTDPILEDVLLTSNPGALILKGDSLFIGKNGSITKINITDDMPVEEVVLSGLSGFVIGFALDDNTLYYSIDGNGSVYSLDLSQPGIPPVTVASGFANSFGLELKGSDLYVSDFNFSPASIFKIDLTAAPATVSTVVTGLDRPAGMTFNGNFLYVAENSRVSRIDINQDMPTAETVVTGLESSRLVAFDGLDMYIAEVISNFGGNGKISKLTIGTPVFSNLGTVCTGTVWTDLGGASPTGGTYSGPGVTDNGDGETFTFDPAAAGGVGSYMITYTATNGESITATLEVTTPPTATFTAPGPFEPTDAAQPLTGGMPMGGTYSGMGVVDNGDGTFSFDPMAVGEGTYAITYTFEDDNGCSDAATSDIVVEVAVPTTLELSQDSLCVVAFTNQLQHFTNLGGGMPEGGVYSGDGVMDDGNGMTFTYTYDPGSTNSGNVTYSVNGQDASDSFTIRARDFSFSTSVNGQSVSINIGTQSIEAGRFFMIDYGDGSEVQMFTESSIPAYTYDQAGTYELCATQFVFEGCDSTFCQTVVIEPFLPGDVCGDATSIDSLFNRPQNVAYTSPLFTNVNYTTDDSDPDFGYECFGEPEGNGGAPSLERTRWFTFVGDGNMYYITTVECNATDYIDFGDTQMAIYTGECDALVASACNEDGPDAMSGGPFPAGLEFQTEEGVEYRMMIDGFGPNFPADGEFCIQVTNLSVTSVADIFGTPYQVFPNPTKGALNITGITPDVVRIQDSYGKLIKTVQNNTNEFSIEDLPNGVYFIQVGLDGSWSTSRIVKTN